MPHIEELSTQWRGSRVSVCQWPPAWLTPSTSKSVEHAAIEEPVTDQVEAPVELPALESFEVAAVPLVPVPSGPPRYPWREQLAGWSDAWREKWGRLSNEREVELGRGWREAEEEAFAEVSAKKAKAEASSSSRRLAS